MGRKMIFRSAAALQERVDEYFLYCKGKALTDDDGNAVTDKYGNPVIVDMHVPTVTGLARFLGLRSRQALLNYQARPVFEDIITEAKMRIEEYAEGRLFDRDGVQGAKFTLCNNFGWSTEPKEEAADSRNSEAWAIPAELIAKSFVDVYRDIREERHGEYVLKGGRGSLKSSFAALIVIDRIKRNPKEHALALRQVGETLKDSVYTKLIWAINVLGLDGEFETKLSPFEIVRKSTGQKIYFRGADDPSKLKSITPAFGYIGVLWLEELDQFRGAEAVRMIEQSALRGGDRAIVIKTFNPPKTKSSWANKYCLTQKETRLVHHSVYTDAPKEWLGKRFIEEAEFLRDTNYDAYEHEYLGVCNGSGGMVFDNVVLREISDEEIANFDRVYMGIDWGWYPDPFRFVKMSYLASERRLIIFDEISGNKLKNIEIAEKLREHNVTGADRITADSGGEGPKSIDDLHSMGFSIRGAIKGPGSVEYSMKWLASLSEIVIDSRRAPHAAREFSEYEYDRDREGEVISAYPDRDNHSIDAVRYATECVWKKRGQ